MFTRGPWWTHSARARWRVVGQMMHHSSCTPTASQTHTRWFIAQKSDSLQVTSCYYCYNTWCTVLITQCDVIDVSIYFSRSYITKALWCITWGKYPSFHFFGKAKMNPPSFQKLPMELTWYVLITYHGYITIFFCFLWNGDSHLFMPPWCVYSVFKLSQMVPTF